MSGNSEAEIDQDQLAAKVALGSDMTGVVGEFERTADRFPIHIRISMISAGDRAGASSRTPAPA